MACVSFAYVAFAYVSFAYASYAFIIPTKIAEIMNILLMDSIFIL